MKKIIIAGVASVALAGAMAAVPPTASAKAVISQLSTADQTAAAHLAESIVVAVMKTQAAVQGAPREQAKVQIQLSVQNVIRNSGVTPVVAEAALEMAQTKLAANGAIDCINPKDDEQTCNPAGLALASLSALLESIVQTAPTATDGSPGPIPLIDTVGFTPPNSGTSDYRGS